MDHTIAPEQQGSRSTTSNTGASRRLSRADWIEAAIKVMVGSSVEQVRVEKLAVDLGASKGSFYWHFKDRNALLDAVLDEWRQRSTLAVEVRLAEVEPDPAIRILRIMQLPLRSKSAARAAELELAIMGWARRSEAARLAVHAVDQARVAHLAELFTHLGLGLAEAEFRSHQAYALLRYVAQRSDMPAPEQRMLIERVHHDLTHDISPPAAQD